jgi:4-hydroxy-tetrahydrodipicolinate reductase
MNSPNITLGINYLLVASQLLQHIAPFTDIEVIEEHFRDKAERSGTAMRIAETLGLDETKINSIRVGGIVGHHEVVFGFPFQTVRLVHDSISREAFGTGALFALRQLHNRSAGLYSYESILREAMLDALRQPCQ